MSSLGTGASRVVNADFTRSTSSLRFGSFGSGIVGPPQRLVPRRVPSRWIQATPTLRTGNRWRRDGSQEPLQVGWLVVGHLGHALDGGLMDLFAASPVG